jgi:hypothetical protein
MNGGHACQPAGIATGLASTDENRGFRTWRNRVTHVHILPYNAAVDRPCDVEAKPLEEQRGGGLLKRVISRQAHRGELLVRF